MLFSRLSPPQADFFCVLRTLIAISLYSEPIPKVDFQILWIRVPKVFNVSTNILYPQTKTLSRNIKTLFQSKYKHSKHHCSALNSRIESRSLNCNFILKSNGRSTVNCTVKNIKLFWQFKKHYGGLKHHCSSLNSLKPNSLNCYHKINSCEIDLDVQQSKCTFSRDFWIQISFSELQKKWRRKQHDRKRAPRLPRQVEPKPRGQHISDNDSSHLDRHPRNIGALAEAGACGDGALGDGGADRECIFPRVRYRL